MRILLPLVLLFLLAAGLPALLAPDAVEAQSPTTLHGRIVNGTTGEAAPAGLLVLLTIFSGDTAVQELTTATEEGGVFSFSDLPQGDDLSYLLTTQYQEVFYQVQVPPDETATVELPVYETAGDPDVLSVIDDTVMVSRSDEEYGELLVRQVIRVRNSSTHTFIPSFGQNGMSAMSFLRFSLPFGYEDLAVQSSLLGGQVIPIDLGVGITAPVPPGIHALVILYTVPYEEDSMVYEPLFPFGAEALRVLMRGDMGTVVGSDLEEDAPVAVGESTFRTFRSTDIQRGERVTVAFTDLPQAPWLDRVWDAIAARWVLSLIIPAVTGVFLLALLVYAWRLRRRVPESMTPEDVASNVWRQPNQRRSLEAIASLDLRFQKGEISEPDYSSLRDELKRSLLRTALKEARGV